MILEIPSSKIGEALENVGVDPDAVFLGDEFYALPTPADVTQKLAPQFTSILSQAGFVYANERRDCDDFARWAAGWAGLFHSQQLSGPSDCGLAFGEVWCEKLQHAFCFAVHRDEKDGAFLVAFYEPQISLNGFAFAEIGLKPEEIASIYLIKA
jgi:hypothetical protein